MSGGIREFVDGKKASNVHHGEALKSNNDSKAVLGNCTEGALARKEKKARSTHAFHTDTLSLSVFLTDSWC